MKVLLIGRSPLQPTGLGKVLLNVGQQLSARHKVVYAASRDPNLHWTQGRETLAWAEFHPWEEPNAYDDPGPSAKGLTALIEGVAPDVVLMLGDVWHFAALPAVRAELGARQPRFVLWLTVCSRPFPLGCAPVVDAADTVLTTTEWGARVLRGELDPVEGCAPRRRPLWRAEAVELGVDPALFHPQGRPTRSPFGEGLVIGWVGVNHLRKNPVHALMIHRALVARRRATLVMKTHVQGQFDLGLWCDDLGLTWTAGGPGANPGRDVYFAEDDVPEALLGQLMRNFEVLLHTSSSGAPDLVLPEAAACGAVTVALDTSCFRDYADVVVPPSNGMPGVPGAWLPLPDVRRMAEALEMLAKLKDRDGALPRRAPSPTRPWGLVAEELEERLPGVAAGWLRRVSL